MNLKQAALLATACGGTVAYLTARGRKDVAAAFVRVATAKALGQPWNEADVELVRTFARTEVGAVGRHLNDVVGERARKVSGRVQDWVNR